MRSRALIVAAVLAATVAACSGSDEPGRAGTGKLTVGQYETAVNVARHEVENQDAKITSATAVLERNGKGRSTNTGHRCTGDQVLEVRLIGSFPHTITTGTPRAPGAGGRAGGRGGGGGGGSTTVTAMVIKADLDGTACLIGVSTARHPKPDKGATVLQLGD